MTAEVVSEAPLNAKCSGELVTANGEQTTSPALQATARTLAASRTAIDTPITANDATETGMVEHKGAPQLA